MVRISLLLIVFIVACGPVLRGIDSFDVIKWQDAERRHLWIQVDSLQEVIARQSIALQQIQQILQEPESEKRDNLLRQLGFVVAGRDTSANKTRERRR